MRLRVLHGALVFCVSAILVAAGCATTQTKPQSDAAAVQLRYTRYGIPHVKAADFRGAGIGLGYAVTRENLCVMAEWFLTVRGERSKFLGADNRYRSLFLIFDDGWATNFESDVFYRYFMSDDRLTVLNEALSDEARDLVAGYADGYNRSLAEFGDAQPKECAGEPWVRPISSDDILRRVYEYTLLAGVTPMLGNIANGLAPKNAQTKVTSAPNSAYHAYRDGASPASNAYAFGRKASANGRGVLLGNPHFPWFGAARRYVAHLTVGEDFNVFGAIGLGFPAVTIGFNNDLAWSQTYSTDQRFAIYALDVDPGDKRSVIIDGKSVPLEAKPVSVEMSSGDTRKVTLYESPFGIMLNSKKFPWTGSKAYALAAINRDNFRTLDQYLAIGRAGTVAAMKSAVEQHQGLQFSNIVAADRQGDTLFANFSVAIDIDDAKLERCVAGDAGREFLAEYDIFMLSGAKSACSPTVSQDQIQPGVIPTQRKPFLFRDDYVLQSNDSHWIVNADPSSYLGGFDRAIGEEGTQRGERLRAGLVMVKDRLSGEDGLPGKGFSPEALRKIFYQSRSYMAEAMVDDIVARCVIKTAAQSSMAAEVDLTKACSVLAGWDRRMQPDSVGALLFIEFMRALPQKKRTPYLPLEALWDVPFDASKPLTTATGVSRHPAIMQALADAVFKMKNNGFALDAPLKDYVYVEVDGERLGGSGGPYNLHMYRVDMTPGVGYVGVPRGGDTFIHATTFDEDGPVSKIVLGKSQATDPSSPYFLDQLPLYLKGEWFDAPFSEADIAADPAYKLIVIDPS
ncbi:MAG: penicillin acylase family protein [Pseudomonadota bacterium]